MEPNIILTDRTTGEVDNQCGMKRWWYKEEGGTGIVPMREEEFNEVGREIHEDFARLHRGEPFNLLVGEVATALVDVVDQILLERSYRRMGWIAAYGLYHLDREREAGEDLLIEHELILARDPLWIACQPDRVWRRFSDGRVIYRELKSCGRMSRGWVDHWPKAIQLHIGMKALEEEFPFYSGLIGQGEVMGLMKGDYKYGKLWHPYVWAYWVEPDEWIPMGQGQGRRGLTPRPVWEYNGGIIEWVKKCGPEIALAQFPFSAPIYLDDRLLEAYVAARTFREREARRFKVKAQTDLECRNRHFKPNFDQCIPVVGLQCPYLDACHNATVNANPLGSGLYKPRTPHHELELTWRDDDSE